MLVSVMRVKFLKGESVKYISHLDLMRTVQRVVRRAHIPVSYSQGFNPHQEISFGAPLPLGVTSEAEYVDIKLGENMLPSALVKLFNENAPDGVKMLEGRILEAGTKSAMALVTHSEYRLSVVVSNSLLGNGIENLNRKLAQFLNQEEILIKKFNKKTKVEKTLNVKPLVVLGEFLAASQLEEDLLGTETETAVVFHCIVKSGSTDNIKPELVIEAFSEFLAMPVIVRRIHRTELYRTTSKGLTDLFGNRLIEIKL